MFFHVELKFLINNFYSVLRNLLTFTYFLSVLWTNVLKVIKQPFRRSVNLINVIAIFSPQHRLSTSFDAQKFKHVCLCICRHLSVFFFIILSRCTVYSWKLTCFITWIIPFGTLFFTYVSMCLKSNLQFIFLKLSSIKLSFSDE